MKHFFYEQFKETKELQIKVLINKVKNKLDV